MKSRRLFIIWSHPLFRDTIRSLLNHQSLEIVGTRSHLDDVLTDIGETKPEIIIVEHTEENIDNQVDLHVILKTCDWDMRVMRLSMEDSELWMYSHHRQNITSTDDLLHIIQDV